MDWNLGLKPWLDKANDWWNAKDIVSQLYLSAVIMALFSMLLLWSLPANPAATAFEAFALLLFAIAYLREAYTWIIPKLELPLVKLSLAALGVMAAAAATGVSRMVVNDATGQDPTHFGTTVALLVPASFVPIVAAMILISGFIVLPATMLWILRHALRWPAEPKGGIELRGWARLFACLILVAGATSLLTSSSPLFPSLRWLASHSAHILDAQPNSACAPTWDDRVLRINDGLVILSRMTADGPQFVRRACPLTAEETPLKPRVSSTHSRESARTIN